ncbi:hypothetical protein FN846DRAFT_888456 [Sphaerosporella brunnea]|uniref:Uncharacterized protein n=1 Tax=Sphaerosporella brunnea TaxID=1250544 RepID=A0A5J5F288_9PEZI|nr:hypothetical protein FN846DRAFT_888456 [Sphaerosporella brunnea]
MASSAEGGEMENTGVTERKAILAEQRAQNRPGLADNTACFPGERDASGEEEHKAAFGDDKAECERTRNQIKNARCDRQRTKKKASFEAKEQEQASYGAEREDTGCMDCQKTRHDRRPSPSGDVNDDDCKSNDYKVQWHKRTEYHTMDDEDSRFSDESEASYAGDIVGMEDAGQVGSNQCSDRGSPATHQVRWGSRMAHTASDDLVGDTTISWSYLRRTPAIRQGIGQLEYEDLL